MLLRSSRIFLTTLPRTGFNTEVCSYFNLSYLDCDYSTILMDGHVSMYSVNRRSTFLKKLYLIVETYMVG